MHDLNTISRLNAETHAKGIKSLQDQGKHVVATYTGLSLLSFEGFATAGEAEAARSAPVDSPDVTRRAYAPTPAGQAVAAHDQSEDRSAVMHG